MNNRHNKKSLTGEEMMDEVRFIIDPAVRRHCGPLFFANSMDVPKGNIFNNGTFALVDTGTKSLLVTCSHVWQQFKESRKDYPDLKFCICASIRHPFAILDIDSMVVDEDKSCDLVTFDVESLKSECLAAGLDFAKLQRNPPPKLKQGDTIYLIGFPGKGREDNVDSVGFPRQALGVTASQVGQFTFLADLSHLKIDAKDVGGISGAPCFVIHLYKAIMLVGFAKGFAPNGMGLLQFTYARFIQADGKIDYRA